MNVRIHVNRQQVTCLNISTSSQQNEQWQNILYITTAQTGVTKSGTFLL
jgi:hypothetical protein